MNGGYLPAWIAPSGDLTSYTPTLRERMVDALRRNLFSDDRTGQQRAERVMGLADLTPAGLAPMAYDIGREGAQGNYAGAGLNLAMAMAPMPKPKGIRAFHGSPHDFERFSLDKIGTGEGAQAYGHGLYFAENEGVAKGYRDNLSRAIAFEKAGTPVQFGDYFTELKNAAKSTGLHPDQANAIATQISDLMDKGASAKSIAKNYDPPSGFEDGWNAALQAASSYKKNKKPGSMYEVNINADPNDFLDWDKPLSEQGPKVQETFKDHVEKLWGPDAYPWVKGQEIYQNLSGAGKYKETLSQVMQQKGIPGIKYLDAGSRGNGDGSRNYVVFDDKLITILRKYGLAGLVPAGLLAANQDQGGQQ